MKILVLADEESESLWDHFEKTKFEGIDLIISCGDLKPEYLSFLVTMTNLDLLYVHGNHDEFYMEKPPEGCVCIDDALIKYKGIRIMGLGGSMRYNSGKFMYTEKEMQKRLNRLKLKLLLNGGVDIIVTHAPPAGVGDMEDIPHKGFECFNSVIEKYKPKFFLHGHVHKSYGAKFQRCRKAGNTEVINAFEKYVIDYPV